MQIITLDNIKKIKLITGLHIGGSEDSMAIGGVDSPVIKREVFCNDKGEVGFGSEFKHKVIEPYIPGSSLKGKVRSLLEHYFKLIDPLGDGNVVDSLSNFGDKNKINLIVKLFGESAASNKKANISRAIFRDSYITNEVRKAYIEGKISLTEEKYENVISRTTGTTQPGGLRQIERVNSALEFDFDISIRVFEGDNKDLFINTIKLGLRLLELDTLGGSGSRGYGKVKFIKIDEDINELIKKIG